MKKWLVLAPERLRSRFEHLQAFLQARGLDNEMEFTSPASNNVVEYLKDRRKDFDFVRLEDPYMSLKLDETIYCTTEAMRTQACDIFLKKNERWWPLNYYSRAIYKVLTHEQIKVDYHGAILLIGANSLGVSMFEGVNSLDFARCHILDPDDDKAEALARELSRRYFNIDFSAHYSLIATQLPGIHSLVVNSLDAREFGSFVDELCLFNFLKLPGLVVDTNPDMDNNFCLSAQKLGASIFNGNMFHSFVDSMWIEEIFGKKVAWVEIFNSFFDYSDQGEDVDPLLEIGDPEVA